MLYIPEDSSTPGEGHHSPHTYLSTMSAFRITTVAKQINPNDAFLSMLYTVLLDIAQEYFALCN